MTKKHVLIGCGVVVLLGLLLVGGCTAFVAYQASQRIITDPDKAEAMAREMMTYEIPGGSKGIMAMDLHIFRIAMVSDGGEQPSIMLMLSEFSEMQGQDPDEMRRSFLDGARKEMTIESLRTEPGTLCGEAAEITISQGTMKHEGGEPQRFVSVQGTVQREGKSYAPMVIVTSDAGEDMARRVFASLRFPR